MSHMPDRLAFGMGSVGFGHEYDQYPATPRSDFSGVADNAGTSTHTEDGSEFFDFELWDLHTRGEVTDVTSPSSISPEENAAPSPSALGPEGPTATVPNHADDVQMLDAGPEEPQPSHVWPRVSEHQPPRDGIIQLDVSQSAEPLHGLARPSSSHNSSEMSSNQNKTRTIKDLDETNRVRVAGSCYSCKMSKCGCDSSPVCGRCRKQPYPELACIRKSLPEIIGAVYARWNWNDPDILLPSRGQFVEDRPVRLLVSLSEDVNSPYLEVKAHPFTVPNHNQGVIRLGIMPEVLHRLEQDIYKWTETHLLGENRTDFEVHMDKLLRGWSAHRRGQRPLAELRKMKCMWKVWSCKQFFVRQEPESQPIPFDMQFASIQDSLRLLAAGKISELERKVIEAIPEHIVKKEATDALITMWIVLWQMIFIYRQALRGMLEQEQTNAAPLPLAMMGANEKRHTFRETTKQLLNAITVIYSNIHKRPTLKRIIAAESQVFSDDYSLRTTFRNAWQRLPKFYDQVLRQVSPADELFKAHIVLKESEFLAKNPPTWD